MKKLYFIIHLLLIGMLPAASVQAGAKPRPLFVSGNFLWAKSMGGTSADFGTSIAVDSSGNIYTTGTFTGTADFNPGAGTANLTSAGLEDIFISKLDSSGNFVWAKRIGGTGYDYGLEIAIDSSGNVYTTGSFYDTVDFDPGAGTANLTSAGLEDIFISKLDSSGNFVWAKTFGGSKSDESYGIAIDSSGNVYTTGYFETIADFDPGPGIFNITCAGASPFGSDIFISKLDSSGNFVWAKGIGGTSGDYGTDITIDSIGNVYTTGFFAGTVDFDPGAGVHNLTSAGQLMFPNPDIFVSKINSDGNFIWAKGIGGTSGDYAAGITIDTIGNVYTTGSFADTADFDPGMGTYNMISAGGNDIFISKLDSSGSLIWAKRMGDVEDDYGISVDVDINGNVYTSGFFKGIADFNPGVDILNLTSAGDDDIFISKLNSSGNFIWANRMGGVEEDQSSSIAVSTIGNVYTTGSFRGIADFDTGTSVFNLTSAGEEDIFVVKLDKPDISVSIGEQMKGSYDLSSSQSERVSFLDVNAGPVHVANTAGKPLVASQVMTYYANGAPTSYSELLGFPANQLTDEYVFPFYNNVDFDSQLRVSNLGGVATEIKVYLGASPTPIDTFTLAGGAAIRKNYAGKRDGPLRVTSSATNILTTIRAYVNNASYSELMGFPANQVTTEYWYPVYDDVSLDSQLRISNIGNDTTTITVFAGGSIIDTYSLPAGQATRKRYGLNTGPLHVVSSAEPILTTLRLWYTAGGFPSYYELTGLPHTHLTSQYFFPWYNSIALDTEMRFANP